VLFDPKKKGRISKETTHHRVDYSAFEGFELEGLPVVVISRGKIVSKDGEFIGRKGSGKYLKRAQFDAQGWS
jgi:dihydropyrimidinase